MELESAKGFHAASSSGGLLHTPARPRDIDGYCLLVAGAGILVHPVHVNVAASLPGIVFKLKPELVKSLSWASSSWRWVGLPEGRGSGMRRA
jgi:hypothetical protein